MDSKKYASPALRVIAHLIEFLVRSTLYLLLLVGIASATDLPQIFNSVLNILVFLFLSGTLIALLQAYLVSQFGGSIGKLLTGIEISDLDGHRLTFKKAFFREFIAKFISSPLFGLGFWWMLRDPNQQTWHDMAASTVVIVKRPAQAIVGALTLVSLIIISGLLVKNIVSGFQKNSDLYTDIFSQTTTLITEEFQKEMLREREVED